MFPVILFASFLALVTVAEGNVFFITAPDVFHYGRDETVSVNILGSNATINVDVYLQDYPAKGRIFSRKSVEVHPNVPQLTEVKVEPEDLPEHQRSLQLSRYVYLVAEAAGFKRETVVLVSSNSHYVFIQTDKPIYTPRQTVNSRVYTMDHNMRPSRTPIRLDVKNPQGIIISRQTDDDLKFEDGIINKQITFPAIVMTGTWSIVASYGYEYQKQVTAKFEVKEYVLPSFSVMIDVPAFVLPSSERLTGHIEARHTYGEEVQGRVEVRYAVVLGETRRHFGTAHHPLDMNGICGINLNLSSLYELGPDYRFPALEGALLHVEATVTEVYTGKSQTSISRNTVFASSPYAIKFPRTSKFFKPALPYVLRIDSKFANGKTAGRIPLQVTATGLTNQGEVVDVERRNADDQQINEVTSDEEGRADFTLDIPRNAHSVTVTVTTADRDLDSTEQGSAEISLTSYSSPSGSYLLVRSTAQILEVGDILEAEVFITNYEDVDLLNYMIIGRGKILYQRTQQRQAGIVTTLHITITPEMSPSIRLLVFYMRVNNGVNEVVADSVWVDVVNKCQNPVSIALNKDKYRPGDDAVVTITGTAGSKVALLAVDQAVYILNDKNTLTLDIMFNRMEDFDLGCTPGGGQNSRGVFQDIGMTTINNAGLSVPLRSHEGCVVPNTRRKREADADNLLSDLNLCCDRGTRGGRGEDLPVQTVRSCRIRAANLRDATPQCVNKFFQCCKDTVTEDTRITEEGGRGRTQDDNTDWDDLFDLINEDEEENSVRRDFRESFLFLTREIGDDGQLELSTTLPDSITSWSMQAVGVSNTTGMCVAPASNVTVFKEFFLKLDMPYSAIVNEQIELRATLYNYRDVPLAANVYLEGNEDICYGARPGEKTEKIRLRIEPQKAKQVAWPIVPLSAGLAIITVKASTSAGSDIVERKLHVLHQGLKKVRTETIVLDPSGQLQPRSGGPSVSQFTEIPLRLPAEYVPGSATCSVSFTGEVMGPVIEAVLNGDTLDKFIFLPFGCGQQTASRLGPLVSVAKYLKETDQVTGERERQLHDYIAGGIQHEMTYRKPDGGFVVFSTDDESNLWLTAFVVRIFSQAREFYTIPTGGGNPDIICSAVQWMVVHQEDNGAFNPYGSLGRTLSDGMNMYISFTANVLIGMLEANCPDENSQRSVNQAITFLEAQLPNAMTSYQAAIVAYALALADSERKGEANEKLREKAVFDAVSGLRHWPLDPEASHQRRVYAIEVETAAYAVLAELQLNEDISYANPIVKWLMTQRGGGGVFSSTQETVIGLQALSEYNIQTRRPDLDLDCVVTSSLDSVRREIRITGADAEVRKEVEVVSSRLGGELFIDTEGEGVGQVQFEMVYNVHDLARELCRFDLTVTAEEVFLDGQAENDLNIRINMCVKYLGANDTGMSILDVGLFTGFAAVTESLEEVVNNETLKISRYEVEDRNVLFYVDTISTETPLCLSVMAKREHIVGMTHPVGVAVYDYYEPSEKCTEFYHPEFLSALVSKICKDEQCICAEVKCGQCYGYEDYYKDPWDYTNLYRTACERGTDYVWKIIVDKINDFDLAFEKINARVEKMVKQGAEEIEPMQNVTFWKKAGCRCPELLEGVVYIVMGRDGMLVEGATGERTYKYLLDAGSYIAEYTDHTQIPSIPDAQEKKLAGDLHRFQRKLAKNGCGD